MWRGKAEVVAGEEGAPGDVGVDGVEDLVDRVLLGRVEDGLQVRNGKGQEECREEDEEEGKTGK